MNNQDLENYKKKLKLSLATNVYFSYNYPQKKICRKGYSDASLKERERFKFSLIVESDYDCMELDQGYFYLDYEIDEANRWTDRLYDYKLCNESYLTEIRSRLRVQARPIIDFLLETGFESETDIEDFMLLKNNILHFTRFSQEKKEAELKKKKEEEKSLQLSKYILMTDDSRSIDSSDIKRFQALSRCSDIVVTLGTEELKETNETIGYIEFIPTTFNDSIRVAFLLCGSDKFAENRGLTNTINRILRFMLPIHEILCKYFEINTKPFYALQGEKQQAR